MVFYQDPMAILRPICSVFYSRRLCAWREPRTVPYQFAAWSEFKQAVCRVGYFVFSFLRFFNNSAAPPSAITTSVAGSGVVAVV